MTKKKTNRNKHAKRILLSKPKQYIHSSFARRRYYIPYWRRDNNKASIRALESLLLKFVRKMGLSN